MEKPKLSVMIAEDLATARRRIAELEAEVRDVRQRLIGGVEGTLAASTVTSKMMAWAEANDRWLRETAPRIATYYDPEQ